MSCSPICRRSRSCLPPCGCSINPALVMPSCRASSMPWRYKHGSLRFFSSSTSPWTPFFPRRIVTEWTAPVPAGFYWEALMQVFPYSMWLFFGAGVLLPVAHGAMQRRAREDGGRLTGLAGLSARTRREFVLLMWGGAFFAYMLSIPHKEVRYLLPLAIPVVTISALGLAELLRWCARRSEEH